MVINIPVRLNNFCLIPYFLMTIAAFMVPSDGNHGFLSIKSLTYVSSMVLVGLHAIAQQRYAMAHIRLFGFFSLALAFLLCWYFVGLVVEDGLTVSQVDQLKLFIITLTLPAMSLYLIRQGTLTPQQLFKTVTYASFAYALVKITLVILHLLKVIVIWDLLYTLGIRFMRTDIVGGLERVQTSADVATPFLIFFVLQSKRLGFHLSSRFKWAYIILSLCSTFLSFSRYFIFVYAMGCLLYWLTLGSAKLFKISLSVGVACVIAFFAAGPENVATIVERRIYSLENKQSDEARVQQINALLNEHDKVPLLGKGIGGYAREHLRDTVLLHSYEVQWVAFLMQFGLIGLFLLFVPLILIGWKLINAPFSRVRFSFLCVFGLWLLSGFTNPFLISLTSGIMYTLFYVSGIILDRK